MKPKKQYLQILLCLIILVLLCSACRIPAPSSDAEILALEQTRVVLALTQTAMSAPQTLPTSAPPEATLPPAATLPPEPTATTAPDVTFEGISFSYDPFTIATVIPSVVPGQTGGESMMPWEFYPTHYQFTFEGYAHPDTLLDPIIRIYPVAEFRTLSTNADATFNEMQTALSTQPPAGWNVRLPFLPLLGAMQMLSARSAYFPFQNGNGVRYLTMYGQAVYKVDNYYLFYTYQGMTNDGRYYLSAIMPIRNSALPQHADTIMSWDSNQWEAYFQQAVIDLQAYPDDSFTPRISVLDAMMASIYINR